MVESGGGWGEWGGLRPWEGSATLRSLRSCGVFAAAEGAWDGAEQLLRAAPRERVRWPIYRDHSVPPAAEDREHFVELVQDEVFAEQTGPFCAAAAIASVAQSYLLAHGTAARDLAPAVDQAYVVELYRRMGVAGLARSTARVGNMTLKRCIHLLRVPGLPGVHLVPRDLAVSLAENDDDRRERFWARIVAELSRGVRLLAHIRNHYVRIYGFRHGRSSACPVGTPLPPDPVKAAPADEGGSSGDEDDSPEPEMQSEPGGRDPSLPPRPRRAASAAATTTPVVTRGAPPLGGLDRRELLTAVRGQRPKHWVSFRDVCDLFDRVPRYGLFAVDIRGLPAPL